MLRKIRKMLKQEEGFTLMELMIAVVIIGILGGIAIPVYKGVQERAKYAVGEANAQMLNRSIVHWIELGMPDENGQPKPQEQRIKENEYDHEKHGADLFAWLGLDEVEYVNWSKGDDEDDDDPRPDDYSPWQYYPDTSVAKLEKPEKPGPKQPESDETRGIS